ncbi:Uncharacterised protein g297 [Pycnogonum litorale]
MAEHLDESKERKNTRERNRHRTIVKMTDELYDLVPRNTCSSSKTSRGKKMKSVINYVRYMEEQVRDLSEELNVHVDPSFYTLLTPRDGSNGNGNCQNETSLVDDCNEASSDQQNVEKSSSYPLNRDDDGRRINLGDRNVANGTRRSMEQSRDS